MNVTTWAILPTKDEDALVTAIATVGPIAISINASPQTFQLYSHGIYDDPSCTSSKVNHAMLAIGYTPQYFILKVCIYRMVDGGTIYFLLRKWNNKQNFLYLSAANLLGGNVCALRLIRTLKNWWGSNWGEDGYMKIKRNRNMCGLANYAAYAIV